MKKLTQLLKESQDLDYRRMNVGEEETQNMTKEEKRAFVEAVAAYHQLGEMISHKGNISEIHDSIKGIVENANNLTLKETGNWFDRVTVQRNMKSMNESFKVFSNTIKEVSTLQQRLESSYDEIGEVLGKYYEIKEGNEFGAQRAKAIAANNDSFEVDGKSYKVTGVDAKDKKNAEEFANESVNEEVYTQKIKFAMQNSTSSFKNLGNDFKKAGLKYNFFTTPFPHYIVEPGGNKKVAIVSNKNQYDLKGSGIQYSTYIATMKESVNESKKYDTLNDFEKVAKISDIFYLGSEAQFKRASKNDYYKVVGKKSDNSLIVTKGNSNKKYVIGADRYDEPIIVVNEESVNEGVSPTDMAKIKGAVEAASSFMNVGSELKKLGMKYTFATEPLPIYIIQPTPNNKVAIVNKKYATKPDFVVGDIAVGIMEGKLNEEEIKWNVVQNAIINFLKMNTKILDKRVQAKDTEGTINGLKSIISGLTNAQRSLKLESVNEIRKGSVVMPYAMDKYGEFIVDKVFKNKDGETSYTGKFKKSGETKEFILHSKDRIVKESVNEAGYTVKGKTPYEFVNGAYAVLSAYLRDEELGPKGKRELQDIIKSLEYMRKYFYFKMSESVNESKLKFKVGDFIKKKSGGNFEYEIKEIDPKFDSVKLYLDTTRATTAYTFKHINNDWKLAESVNEENKPTNPALWSRAKAAAKAKYDVYPSAYANGYASKWYKKRGGSWKTENASPTDMEEGNEFGAERAKAIAANKDSFKVDGKTYKVTGVDAEDKKNAEEFANESMKLTQILAEGLGPSQSTITKITDALKKELGVSNVKVKKYSEGKARQGYTFYPEGTKNGLYIDEAYDGIWEIYTVNAAGFPKTNHWQMSKYKNADDIENESVALQVALDLIKKFGKTDLLNEGKMGWYKLNKDN